jgi:hypothetical protein
MAATPAASIQEAKVLVDGRGAAWAAWIAGTSPKTVLVVVFIFNSLNLMFLLLAVQNGKLNNQIIGFLPMRFNFIFMMSFIHNGDVQQVIA